jgi:hypothetical protein
MYLFFLSTKMFSKYWLRQEILNSEGKISIIASLITWSKLTTRKLGRMSVATNAL